MSGTLLDNWTAAGLGGPVVDICQRAAAELAEIDRLAVPVSAPGDADPAGGAVERLRAATARQRYDADAQALSAQVWAARVGVEIERDAALRELGDDMLTAAWGVRPAYLAVLQAGRKAPTEAAAARWLLLRRIVAQMVAGGFVPLVKGETPADRLYRRPDRAVDMPYTSVHLATYGTIDHPAVVVTEDGPITGQRHTRTIAGAKVVALIADVPPVNLARELAFEAQDVAERGPGIYTAADITANRRAHWAERERLQAMHGSRPGEWSMHRGAERARRERITLWDRGGKVGAA